MTEIESGNAFVRSDHAAIIDDKTFPSVNLIYLLRKCRKNYHEHEGNEC